MASSSLRSVIAVVASSSILAGLAGGCAKLSIQRPPPSRHEFVVPCPRSQVYDDALAFAQASNLNVAVLEKSSGLIKFERASLNLVELDTFCEFPFLDPDTKQPIATYWEWVTWWGEYVGNPSVSLNVLMSDRGPKATAVSIRGDWSADMSSSHYRLGEEKRRLASTGALEGMLREYLVSRCEGRTAPETTQIIEDFEASYAKLRESYEDGKLKETEYQERRDQLLESLHRSLGATP